MTVNPNLLPQLDFLLLISEHTCLPNTVSEMVCSYLFRFLQPEMFLAENHKSKDNAKLACHKTFWHKEKGLPIYQMIECVDDLEKGPPFMKLASVLGYAMQIQSRLRSDIYNFYVVDETTAQRLVLQRKRFFGDLTEAFVNKMFFRK